MANLPLLFALLLCQWCINPVTGQTKSCNLSANDLIKLVGASDKTVNDAMLHHCFVVDKSANNGAKANFRKDYKAGGKSYNDVLFTVTTGSVTEITTSAAAYNSYLTRMKNKGFKYAGKDDYGKKYIYGKYLLYASINNDKPGVSSYGFMLDKE